MTIEILERYGSPTIKCFTEAVLHRPQMYTLNGTLEEVFVFLEGFYSGAAKHNKNLSDEVNSCWNDFNEFVISDLGFDEDFSWRYAFEAVRKKFPDDSEAFAYLIDAFLRFNGYRAV